MRMGDVEFNGCEGEGKWTLLCHHDPSRSFCYKGKPFPLCSRCTGFWGAVILFSLVGLFIKGIESLSPLLLILLYIICLTPLALDGYTQYVGWRSSNNYLRFLTGFLAGAIGGIIIAYLVRNVLAIIL
ncbi:MAG: DUF2085 domain-containing protein [Thermoplasmata archaeon]|nr:DUF2085 domain-containing protein [Thermoplasmata archaeon]